MISTKTNNTRRIRSRRRPVSCETHIRIRRQFRRSLEATEIRFLTVATKAVLNAVETESSEEHGEGEEETCYDKGDDCADYAADDGGDSVLLLFFLGRGDNERDAASVCAAAEESSRAAGFAPVAQAMHGDGAEESLELCVRHVCHGSSVVEHGVGLQWLVVRVRAVVEVEADPEVVGVTGHVCAGAGAEELEDHG